MLSNIGADANISNYVNGNGKTNLHLVKYFLVEGNFKESTAETDRVGTWAASSAQCMSSTLNGIKILVKLNSFICNSHKLIAVITTNEEYWISSKNNINSSCFTE